MEGQPLATTPCRRMDSLPRRAHWAIDRQGNRGRMLVETVGVVEMTRNPIKACPGDLGACNSWQKGNAKPCLTYSQD